MSRTAERGDVFYADFRAVMTFEMVTPFWSRMGWSILGHCLLALPMGLLSPWVAPSVFGSREWLTRKNGVPLWHKTLEVVAPTLVGYLVSLWV